MAERLDPIAADLRLAQLLGDEDPLGAGPAMPAAASPLTPAPAAPSTSAVSGNPFEDMLGRAVEALDGVNRSEAFANEMITKYIKGEVDLQDVMIAQSKMSIMVQLAVTTINTTVTTFKEITQIQV